MLFSKKISDYFSFQQLFFWAAPLSAANWSSIREQIYRLVVRRTSLSNPPINGHGVPDSGIHPAKWKSDESAISGEAVGF